MVAPDGQVKILDFGIGCLLAETEGESLVDTMSTANSVNSGLDCSSPESIMDPTNLNAVGDQYSLGCVIYYCLTGQYPFPDGTAVEKMMCHQHKQPTPILDLNPHVPEEYVPVVERLMQKNPENRYPSFAEVIEALQPLTNRSTPPRPAAPADDADAAGQAGPARHGRRPTPASPMPPAPPHLRPPPEMPKTSPRPAQPLPPRAPFRACRPRRRHQHRHRGPAQPLPPSDLGRRPADPPRPPRRLGPRSRAGNVVSAPARPASRPPAPRPAGTAPAYESIPEQYTDERPPARPRRPRRRRKRGPLRPRHGLPHRDPGRRRRLLPQPHDPDVIGVSNETIGPRETARFRVRFRFRA